MPEPNEAPASGKASPWNSLEIGKLVIAAATPIMIFAVGVWLNREAEQRRRDDLVSDKAAADRQAELIRAADKLERGRAETRRRHENALLKQQERIDLQAARWREDAIRHADQARDDAIRREGVARDRALREAQTDLANKTSVVQLRLEVWRKIGPRIHDVRSRLLQLCRSPSPDPADPRAREARQVLNEANREMDVYFPFFSPQFLHQLRLFQKDARAATVTCRMPRDPAKAAEAGARAERSALDLVAMMGREMGIASGPGESAEAVGGMPLAGE